MVLSRDGRVGGAEGWVFLAGCVGRFGGAAPLPCVVSATQSGCTFAGSGLAPGPVAGCFPFSLLVGGGDGVVEVVASA